MRFSKKHITTIALSVGFVFQVSAQKNLKQLLKQYNDKGVPYISVQELAMPKSDVLLLDTREPSEYEISHLKNAVCVGYNSFDVEKFQKQYPNKAQQIVVYCSLGIRSETIGEKLKAAGYINIKNLYGGIFEWKNKGFSVYNANSKETDSVHVFSKAWGKWLKNGFKVYPKRSEMNYDR